MGVAIVWWLGAFVCTLIILWIACLLFHVVRWLEMDLMLSGNQSWFGILQYPDINTHIAFFDLQHEIGARLLTMDQVPKKMAILGWPHYHRHDLPKFWACKKRLYNIEMDPNVVTIGRCRILAASLCEDECMLSYTAIPFLPSWATDRFFGLGGLFSRM